MKFATTLVALALTCAGLVEGRAHIQRRHGVSATYTGPSSTAAPAPAPSSSGTPATGGNGKIKRGASYNQANLVKNFNPSKVAWAYNWYSASNGLSSQFEYVPMLWDTGSDHINVWSANAQAAIDAGSTHLLAFNEPDLSSQANMSPQQAADAYKKYMMPFAGKAKLVSPAVTNGGPPMGLAWMDEFLNLCTDCQIDAIAIHIYDSTTNVAYFQNYITEVGQKYGKPVWITEFGASGSTADQQSFLDTMLPWLDSQDFVQRYAYFTAGQGILVGDDASLLSLGQTYNTI